MPHPRPYRVEACVVSYEQAIAAMQQGADRLELCSRLETEGMTPDLDLTIKILEDVKIPVRIMIRETETGFESDDQILEQMKHAIVRFRSISIDGFVIGLLKNNRLDRESMQEMIDACSPFLVTIHKALDASQYLEEDIKWLNQFSNVDTILTSGSCATAQEGIDQILKMKSWFKGHIMGAGRITKDLLPELHDKLQLKWYHGRAIV